jgi:hypothetical protein
VNHFDDSADEVLFVMFDEFRDETLPTVPAPEAASVPATVRRRRRRTVLVATSLAVVLLAGGGSYAATQLSGARPGPGGGPPVGGQPGSGVPLGSPDASPSIPPSPSTGTSDPGAAPPPQGAPTTGTAIPRCHTGDLTIKYGPSNGAAGTDYEYLGFTNKSTHTCRMYGFPGMAPVDARGKQIPVTVARTNDQPKTVTLAPGQTGWALVRWAVAPGTYSGPACQPGGSALAVTPPDETTQLTLPGVVRVCGSGTITTAPITDQSPPPGA